jgi:hypothetical protein
MAFAGYGIANAMWFLSFGVCCVVGSSSDVLSMVANVLFDGNGDTVDLHWHFSPRSDALHLLSHASVRESIVSSHPFVFADLFVVEKTSLTGAAGKDSDEVVLPLNKFSSYFMNVTSQGVPSSGSVDAQHRFHSAKAQLAEFVAEAVHAAPPVSSTFVQFVERSYLDPISEDGRLRCDDVYRVTEETEILTTPKGLWTYATGNGRGVRCSLTDAWQHKRRLYVLQLRKILRSGGLGEMFVMGWFPLQLLERIAPSRI